ncbi:LysR family transcriptional regulator [Enterobacter quasiroggenkampii]|uniref:LysR family transcriptional regulator n=1 Tax=Enterobacter quasiroggenkampii TaxID=2497436 RepID=UPI0039C0DC4C
MPYISSVRRINEIDLNAMLFFVVYMKYRKISSVSTILNCSSPTVSIMLKKFSQNFSEVLFERKSRNLTPTLFAHELFVKCEKVIYELCDIYFDVSFGVLNDKS